MQGGPTFDRDTAREAEQRHIDYAYACLDAMRERVRTVLDHARRDADSAPQTDAIAIERALVERLRAVAESKAALTFGRIDARDRPTDPSQRWYIGRRHIEDAKADPVVIDWRAPVAAPFYRATWADPLGLDLRRRFAIDGRELVGFFDEDFSDPDGESAGGGGGGVPDPLLAELERARTGEMRDIVATIQAEQDIVIRAPMSEMIVVQGGPGTGKTAVGLHRAAYLLFAHRDEMERRKLLVVGPNRIFLSYIAQVLPSLGETAAVQATIESLLARSYPVRSTEPAAVARMKGDPRMADVLRRAVFGRIADPVVDSEVMTAFGMARFPTPDVTALVRAARKRALASNAGRDVLREQLVALAWRVRMEKSGAPQEQQFAFSDDLRKSTAFKKFLDGLWPSMTAGALVRSLLASPKMLSTAAEGVLDRAEQALLRRKQAAKASDEQWTRADLGLIDEAAALIDGEAAAFAHVVVDEAQDLSAMELRMVARRAFRGSMTILGDLAQATGVGARLDWDDALVHLGLGRRADNGRVAELELGYRVPAPVLDFANRLLPVAAPGLRPAQSVRTAGSPPEIVAVSSPDLLAGTVADVVSRLQDRHTSIGVLAGTGQIETLAHALRALGVKFSDGRGVSALDDGVTLLAAVVSKGLEFDAVVVVEPAAIVEEDPHAGYRVLYVSLTRAVQHLSIVHARPLPDALAPVAQA